MIRLMSGVAGRVNRHIRGLRPIAAWLVGLCLFAAPLACEPEVFEGAILPRIPILDAALFEDTSTSFPVEDASLDDATQDAASPALDAGPEPRDTSAPEDAFVPEDVFQPEDAFPRDAFPEPLDVDVDAPPDATPPASDSGH
jgi:hypothetical protein